MKRFTLRTLFVLGIILMVQLTYVVHDMNSGSAGGDDGFVRPMQTYALNMNRMILTVGPRTVSLPIESREVEPGEYEIERINIGPLFTVGENSIFWSVGNINQGGAVLRALSDIEATAGRQFSIGGIRFLFFYDKTEVIKSEATNADFRAGNPNRSSIPLIYPIQIDSNSRNNQVWIHIDDIDTIITEVLGWVSLTITCHQAGSHSHIVEAYAITGNEGWLDTLRRPGGNGPIIDSTILRNGERVRVDSLGLTPFSNIAFIQLVQHHYNGYIRNNPAWWAEMEAEARSLSDNGTGTFDDRFTFLFTNRVRWEAGLPPYIWDDTLFAAAQDGINVHAHLAIEEGRRSNTGYDGSSADERARRNGFKGSASEITHMQSSGPPAVITFIRTAGNRSGILSGVRTHIGIRDSIFVLGNHDLTAVSD